MYYFFTNICCSCIILRINLFNPVLMQTFKIGPDGVAQIKKKSLLRSIPISLLAATFGITVAIINSRGVKVDISTFIPMIIFVPIALGFGFRRGLKRLQAMMESYELTISENLIIREQVNTPDISIYHSEVREIVQLKNGNFSIKGSRNNGIIIIPAQIDNYTQLETILKQIHPIATKSRQSRTARTSVSTWLLVFASRRESNSFPWWTSPWQPPDPPSTRPFLGRSLMLA